MQAKPKTLIFHWDFEQRTKTTILNVSDSMLIGIESNNLYRELLQAGKFRVFILSQL